MKIFFNINQNVPDEIPLPSPSASKPLKVVKRFQKVFDGIEVVDNFDPLSPEIIARAHDPSHVMNILNGNKPNGFNTIDLTVAKSLMWTNASFYNAAKEALLSKSFTMSPTSGFHHASYSRSEGFCTFNGLVISAILLQEEFDLNKIGIFDCDAHHGNGTDEIKKKLKLDFIVHETFGYYTDYLKEKMTHTSFGVAYSSFEEWITKIPEIMENGFKECNILFYQAGADPHINDMYGGYLTTKQLRLRDRAVFETARKMGIPLVWNLAGGYQEPIRKVLDIHQNTMTECLRVINKK